MQGEHPDGVPELALAGVDAAHHDVEDQVSQLVVCEALAAFAVGLGGDQVGDQVVAGRIAALSDELIGPGIEVGDRGLDPGAAFDQAGGVELELNQIGPFLQTRRVSGRCAHDPRDHQRRVGLGEVADEFG
jgi:hypothetical protein